MTTADDGGARSPIPEGPEADEPSAQPVERPGRRLVAAVAAGTLALLAVVGGTVLARDDSPPGPAPLSGEVRPDGEAVPTPTAPADSTVASAARVAQADAAALGSLLADRSAALDAGDRAAWLRPIDPAAPDLRAREATIWDRLQALPFDSYGYAVRGVAVPAPSADVPGAWDVDVELAYRLPGDTRDVTRDLVATAVRRDGQVRLLDLAPAPSESTPVRDLWDLTDISVREQGRALVVAAATDARSLRRYATAADAAARRVDEVWGEKWRRVVVVLVPSSVEQLAAVLGRGGTAGLDQIAAVTTGEIDRVDGTARASATADRIVLNPDELEKGGDRRYREIVLVHEMTHVATRGSILVGPPLWVEEGFADWVAYRGSGLTRAQVASSLLDRVRAGTGPDRLPTDEDFDPAQGDVDRAYAGAWLAFDLVERRRGQDAAIDFYRTAAGLSHAGPGAEQTSRAALARAYRVQGTDEEGFTRSWLNRLDDLADAGPGSGADS